MYFKKMSTHTDTHDVRFCSFRRWSVSDTFKTLKVNIHQSNYHFGGARGVMIIVAGIGHGDTSSNPGLIAFHIALIPLGKV